MTVARPIADLRRRIARAEARPRQPAPSPAENLRDLVAAADRLVARLAERATKAQAPAAAPGPMPRSHGRTAPGNRSPACEGCGSPLPPIARLRGEPRRFCSAACRARVWRATRQRSREVGAPTEASPAPTVPLSVRRRRLELWERTLRLGPEVAA